MHPSATKETGPNESIYVNAPRSIKSAHPKEAHFLLGSILRYDSPILTKLVSLENFCYDNQELHANYLSDSNCSKVVDKKIQSAAKLFEHLH